MKPVDHKLKDRNKDASVYYIETHVSSVSIDRVVKRHVSREVSDFSFWGLGIIQYRQLLRKLK
jgi:hypothetical protein